jgi:pimeloyl-ACP methyl ester carboxylesterase
MSEKSYYFESTHGKIHYRSIPVKILIEEKGKKPIIFFLHGASKKTQNTEYWSPLQEQIYNHCIPIKVDTLGNGLSHFYGREIEETFEVKLDSLIELVDHLTTRIPHHKFGICGRSLGGALAVSIAAKIGKRIDLLGLIAPGGMKTFANLLHNWDKPISILWDVEDPIVPFQSLEYIKNLNLSSLKLYTLGYTSETTVQSISRTEVQDTAPTHVPELIAPQLFTQFLSELCNQI